MTQSKIYSPTTLLVAKVKIENADKEKADLRILQVYWGNESAEIIKCFKDGIRVQTIADEVIFVDNLRFIFGNISKNFTIGDD